MYNDGKFDYDNKTDDSAEMFFFVPNRKILQTNVQICTGLEVCNDCTI